jgi:uncharacterized coiled-coil DUF342 family protein
MSIGALSESDKSKLKELINQGVQVTNDVKTLKEGLNELIAAVSEEMEIPKNVLTKAIKVAVKMGENRDELQDGREELDAVEEILMVVGKSK